ncbi:hypothetical protein HGH92_22215 [Chitinophaga varians]|uniref:Uncharacterized protein n=1 Tax=Chitinophaga varians TaxID=2202339 RepID=A0A847RMM5_9BACT|nr:hypothetical protein [Chitinophaga varians]NLR67040.1 hypothetical protein [Chitinophaga varians]
MKSHYYKNLWLTGLYLLTVFTAAAQKNNKYLKGSYIDSTGQKIDGFISMQEMGLLSFDFKKQLGDKNEKIKVSGCQAFSFENHSFCTLKNVTIRTRIWHYHFDKVFAEQVIDGPLQLYRLYFKPGKVGYMRYVALAGRFAPGPASAGVGVFMNNKYVNYFLRKSGDTTGYCFIGKKRKDFITSLTPWLKEDTLLVRRIKTGGDYSFNNIESVVREYNDYIVNKQ